MDILQRGVAQRLSRTPRRPSGEGKVVGPATAEDHQSLEGVISPVP